jgi:hypothetical protein
VRACSCLARPWSRPATMMARGAVFFRGPRRMLPVESGGGSDRRGPFQSSSPALHNVRASTIPGSSHQRSGAVPSGSCQKHQGHGSEGASTKPAPFFHSVAPLPRAKAREPRQQPKPSGSARPRWPHRASTHEAEIVLVGHRLRTLAWLRQLGTPKERIISIAWRLRDERNRCLIVVDIVIESPRVLAQAMSMDGDPARVSLLDLIGMAARGFASKRLRDGRDCRG